MFWEHVPEYKDQAKRSLFVCLFVVFLVTISSKRTWLPDV